MIGATVLVDCWLRNRMEQLESVIAFATVAAGVTTNGDRGKPLRRIDEL